MQPHAASVEVAFAEVSSSRTGLTEAEAQQRLARFGRNALRAVPPISAWRVLLDQLRSVVVALLIAATLVSAAVGDIAEAVAIGAVLLINTAVGFVTEIRARRAMEGLLRLDAPRAHVIRDGRAREIDAHDVVPGDVVLLEPGQSIAADARLIEATDLRTNEAPLTGESLPVEKRTRTVAVDTPLADRSNMVYKGTTAVAGSGRALVVATGMATELGRIGGLLGGIREERTPLEHRLDSLGRRLMGLAVAAGAAVVAVGALHGVPLAQLLETGIALAIAAVPEGLPAVATVALAIGVRRMSRRHALVRRLPSVETLGSVTVICSDKTGTLTSGEMVVTTIALPGHREIAVSGAGYEPSGRFLDQGRVIDPMQDAQLRMALHITMLANRADVTLGEDGWVVRGDPTEGALLVASRKAGLERERLIAAHPEAGEVPFSSERMFMATFHHVADDGLVAHVKGAPGRILDRCTRVLDAGGERPMDADRRREFDAANDDLASRGLRVIALATGPTRSTDESSLSGLTFVGLAGMMDAAAPGVKETIQRFRDAGIRTVMITGDQRRTAEAIAADLGILTRGGEVLDGRALSGLSDADLEERIERVAGFSRVSPESKLAIVTALQRRGEIVAMLGDGVNDAAALKKADVGVAMGIRGTDIARETAAIVLQDDRFPTIAAAIEEGRVIFDNIRKFVFYLFSCNLAEVLILLVAGIAGYPMPLLPLQILWLNLVTDTFPALALAMEPAEHDVMRRPPRDPDAAILSRGFVAAIGGYAGLITVATLAAFAIAIAQDGSATTRATTMSFATLGLAQALHLGNARRRGAVLHPEAIVANRWGLGAVLLVVVLQVIAVELAPLAAILRTQPLAPRDWLLVALLASVPAVAGQLIKSAARSSVRRRGQRRSPGTR